MTALASYSHLRSRLQLALAINAVIIAAEFIGGWLLDSIGLMSDAGHNLVDQGSLFTINADFHYDLPSRSSTIFWLGGGLGISRFSFEDFSNTDTGLNLLMGASFSRRPVIPFIQVKVMVMDDTQLVLGGGLTF